MAKTGEVFAVSDRVHHSEYGLGKITGLNARHTIIEFDGVGLKMFVTDIVRLKHSDAPAPAKPARKSRAKAAKTS